MLKFKYRVARCWIITKRDTLSPLFDKAQFFTLLTLPIFLLLSLIAGDISEEVTSLGKTFLAVIMTLPIWFIINLVLSPFRALKEEKEEGSWSGGRFVYHFPKHIHTFLVTPDKDKQNIRITIKDAPPNSFVQFKIEYDGGLASLLIKNHKNSRLEFPGTPENLRKITYGVRLNKKCETVVELTCPQNSSETVARVMAVYFDIRESSM